MLISNLLWLPAILTTVVTAEEQRPLSRNHGPSDKPQPKEVSIGLFASLERLARLVDISYCVGTTGISPPFSCASRCKEFPALRLVTTWNTGILLSDSCGYVAVDHGDATAPGRADGARGAIVVAFRGTYSITNTVVDLSTVPQEYVPYPEPDDDGDDNRPPQDRPKCDNCTVHMGFLASWRNARKLVLPAIHKARAAHPDYAIQLVGHSLGGAVAALAALELKLVLGIDDLTVTTFGEPRVGNQGLVAFLDHAFDMDSDDGYDSDLEKRAYRRVTHADDPVPLLPLTEWGFRPHAGEIFIAKPDLSPAPADLRLCRGDADVQCSAGDDESVQTRLALLKEAGAAASPEAGHADVRTAGFPKRLKLWQLFFAHRDYFWRLGLCVPGGDPADWGREKYNFTRGVGVGSDEL